MHKLAFLFALLLLINIGSSAQLSPSEQSNFRIAVDGDSPIINIISPKNTIYSNQTPLLVNYTIFDITLDSAWYSLNNEKNTSISDLFYLVLQEGNYNLRIYANDSSNRINFSEVSFRINNSIPLCGDAGCNSGEDCIACPADCGSCPSSVPGAGSGGGFPAKSGVPSSNKTLEESEPVQIPDESDKTAEQNIIEIIPTRIRFPYTSQIVILTIAVILIIFYYITKDLNILPRKPLLYSRELNGLVKNLGLSL